MCETNALRRVATLETTAIDRREQFAHITQRRVILAELQSVRRLEFLIRT
jgi:hypothetical protein